VSALMGGLLLGAMWLAKKWDTCMLNPYNVDGEKRDYNRANEI